MGHTKRWTHLYPEHIPESVEVEHANLPEGWKARVARDPDNTALVYFDRVFSAAEVDRKSDALAAALAQRGIGKGDCVGLKLQNIPQFPPCSARLVETRRFRSAHQSHVPPARVPQAGRRFRRQGRHR